MLVSEEVDVRARKIIREIEKHYIVIKGKVDHGLIRMSLNV